MSSALLQPQNRLATRRPKLWRDEIQVVVNTTDTRLLSPNPRRHALVFSTPVGSSGSGQFISNASIGLHNVSGAATGVLATYTVPAGQVAILNSYGYKLLGGTNPTTVLEYTPNGGSTLQLAPALAQSTIFQPELALGPGDTVDWRVVTLGAGSTMDFFMGIKQLTGSGGGGGTDNTVFISADGPAAVNGGMALHPGAPPLVLLHDHIGQAFTEEIHGIAGSSAVTLTIWDIFEVDCPCQNDY